MRTASLIQGIMEIVFSSLHPVQRLLLICADCCSEWHVNCVSIRLLDLRVTRRRALGEKIKRNFKL